MDPQIEQLKELIRQNTALTQEVHAMVKSMHRTAVWGRVGKFIWLVVIAAFSVGAFFYLLPYLQEMKELYDTAQQALEQARQFGNQFQGQ